MTDEQKADLAVLKPCPFCGGEDLMRFCDPAEGDDNSGPSRRIQCSECFIEAPFYPTSLDAVTAWNTRSARLADAVQPAAGEGGLREADGAVLAAPMEFKAGVGASFNRDLDSWVLYSMPDCTRFGVIDGFGPERINWVMATLRAALSTSVPAGVVGIKPLEWEEVGGNCEPETLEAKTQFGRYQAFEDQDSAAGSIIVEWAVLPQHFGTTDAVTVCRRCTSFEDAQAKAQADYDTRVRACLAAQEIIR